MKFLFVASIAVLGLTFSALELVLKQRPTIAQVQSSETAGRSQTITGNLTANSPLLADGSHYNTHTFEGNAGEFVVLEMSSSDFDTYLGLRDPQGNSIAENDDADGTNSRIAIALPTTGTYTVWATSYTPGATGNYTLSIRQINTAQVLADADRLAEQGNQQLNEGQVEAAISTFQQASAIYQQVNAGDRVAAIQQQISTIQQQLLPIYQQQLTAFREAENQQGELNVLLKIANFYSNQKQYLQAREYYEQALTVARQIDDRFTESITLNSIGQSYTTQGISLLLGGSFQDSLELFQQAFEPLQAGLTLAQQIEDPVREELGLVALSLNYQNIGNAYFSQEQYAEAIAAAQQSLIFAYRSSNQELQLMSLKNLGHYQISFGRQYRLERNFEQALKESQEALIYGQQMLDLASAGLRDLFGKWF